eukprot:scaffold5266_cov20-Prasinocladus_malaysianus.AAC.1
MGNLLVISADRLSPANEFGASANLTDLISWPLAARLGTKRAQHMIPCMHAILNEWPFTQPLDWACKAAIIINVDTIVIL